MIPSMTPTDQRTTESEFVAEALRAEADAIVRIAECVATENRDHWKRALDLLADCQGNVVVAGMGKSGLIGAKMSATYSSLGQPSNVHPHAGAAAD